MCFDTDPTWRALLPARLGRAPPQQSRPRKIPRHNLSRPWLTHLQQVDGSTATSYLQFCHEFLKLARNLRGLPYIRAADLCRSDDQSYDDSYLINTWSKFVGTTQMRFQISNSDRENIVHTIRAKAQPTVSPELTISNYWYVMIHCMAHCLECTPSESAKAKYI